VPGEEAAAGDTVGAFVLTKCTVPPDLYEYEAKVLSSSRILPKKMTFCLAGGQVVTLAMASFS
jgi:hypothetical protein